MTSGQGSISEAELARLDVREMLRDGLADPEGDAHRTLFGPGAVAAAIALDRLRVIPRSLTYLAEVVHAGGTRYGAALAEPLPEPVQTEMIRPWLQTAAATVSTVDGDEQVARWLQAVASIIALRIVNRGPN